MILAALCCALVCFAAGLVAQPIGQVTPEDRRLAVAGTVLQLGGGAVLGWLVGWMLSLTPSETAALALIGAAPGTYGANALVVLAGGRMTAANAMLWLSGLATVAVTLIVLLLSGASSAFGLLIIAVLLPFCTGGYLRKELTSQVTRLIQQAAGIALAMLIVAALYFGTAGGAFLPLAGGAFLLAVALTLFGNTAGRAIAGQQGATLLSLTLPMRNVAVPIVIGFASGLSAAPLAAAIYGIVMYLPTLLVMALTLKNAKR